MSWSHSAACVPYGAFELKATYQRNMLLRMVTVLILTGLLVAIGTVVIDLTRPIIIGSPPDRVIIDARPVQPPTVLPTRPSVPNPPAPPKNHGSMPVAIPDSLISDQDKAVPSTDELRAGFGDGPDSGAGLLALVVPDSEFGRDRTESFPTDTEFVIVEKYPEFVYQKMPFYPETARRLGQTGMVWIRALVDREGKVREAKVFRSSGYGSLDQAAVDAAYGCVFTPAIQNGHPKAIWVSYKVLFRLNN